MIGIGFIFWLLMLFALVFGCYSGWPARNGGTFTVLGGGLLTWVLLFILGWKVFGFPIHG